MDNMMPSPYRGRNSGQWRGGGGAQARGRRSNDFQSPFGSPYQNTWSSPADGSAQCRPYGRGSPSPRYQSNQGYQNSGRSSYGGFRGTPGSSYKNRNQNGQQEVDIRAYVIPAMTQNPWKDLEEQWKREKAAGVDDTVNQQ